MNETVSVAFGDREQAEAQRIDSTSDQRVANNVMRHEYRVLSDAEKAQMSAIMELGDAGIDFLSQLHQIGGTWQAWMDSPRDADVRLGSRELSLAATKMEEAVMWAVKHVTR